MLVIDTVSPSRADIVVTELVQAISGLKVMPLQTQLSPQTIMAFWLLDGDKLSDDDRFGFSPDRECELKSWDDEKSVVKYARHNLLIDEVCEHIKQGKLPTRLAMTWNGRVSFVLDSAGRLRKLKFLEAVFDDKGEADDGFDADVAILTGELGRLIPDLVEALGGDPEDGAP